MAGNFTDQVRSGKLIITGAKHHDGRQYLNGGVVEVSSWAKTRQRPHYHDQCTLRYTGHWRHGHPHDHA